MACCLMDTADQDKAPEPGLLEVAHAEERSTALASLHRTASGEKPIVDVHSIESLSMPKAMLYLLQTLILLEYGGWRGRHRYHVHALGRKEPSAPDIYTMHPACQLPVLLSK